MIREDFEAIPSDGALHAFIGKYGSRPCHKGSLLGILVNGWDSRNQIPLILDLVRPRWVLQYSFRHSCLQSHDN